MSVSIMGPTKAQRAVQARAIAFAKAQKKVIARRIANKAQFPPEEKPVSVFMAGSPGAGKTEGSKALIASFENEVLRIDPDDLRLELADYDGANSWLFQPAVSIVVEKIHDLALAQQQSFMLDGTLTNTSKAADNISRSLKKGRYVQILYVYQDPIVAWDFVQAREKVEGRKILREHFIEQYFAARDSVNMLKRTFGKKVFVDLLFQNSDNSQKLYKANIDQIDNHVPEKYTLAALESQLRRI